MLLLRPPVSHTLIHTITKNQIQISLVAAVGHLLIHFQVAGGGGGGGGEGVQGKKHQVAHRWDGALCSLLNVQC